MTDNPNTPNDSYEGPKVDPAIAALFQQESKVQSASSVVDGTATPHLSRPRKRRRWPKVLIGVLIVMLVFAGSAFGLGAWYVGSIDKNMQVDSETKEKLDEVLAPNADMGEPYYVLLMGADSREGSAVVESIYKDGSSRADVLILARVDPKTKTVTLVSIPRDTPVEYEGKYMKMNEVLRDGGPSAEIQAVEDVTGVDIAHYVEIDFVGLEHFIDTLGGIHVDVPEEITGTDIVNGGTITVPAGKDQLINGKEALLMARQRHQYSGNQDYHRQSNVREVTTGIIEELASKPVAVIPSLISDLSNSITTDMSTMDMLNIANGFLGSDISIYSTSGPSDGDIDPETELWFCYQNPDGWKALIEEVNSGKDPASIDYESTAYVHGPDVPLSAATAPAPEVAEGEEAPLEGVPGEGEYMEEPPAEEAYY